MPSALNSMKFFKKNPSKFDLTDQREKGEVTSPIPAEVNQVNHFAFLHMRHFVHSTSSTEPVTAKELIPDTNTSMTCL